VLFVEPFFLLVVLPAALLSFYFAGRRRGPTSALAVIVIASAVFYAPYGARNALILTISLVLNFAIGVALAGLSELSDAQRKGLLAIGLAGDFANLATFKYIDQVAALAAPSWGPVLGFAIPAGISFYTFHQAVFLFHAYKRQPDVVTFVANARNLAGKFKTFVRYSAFVAFFPQLIIGPITYMSEFAPQIAAPGFGRPRLVNFQVGATLIIVGLSKKLLIADYLAGLADPIFHAAGQGATIDSAHARLAVVAYFFQLYFDFSGYSDISLGIARLFGLRLPMNFDSPLRATGIVDFYRRWHMTLTRVIVLFVFTPLSLWGMRAAVDRGWKGWRRRALGAWVPFLINFEVIALWHSAKTTFMLFGLIHGAWYVLETEFRASRSFKTLRARTSERFRAFVGMAITAAPLMLTFALFRSDSLHGFSAVALPFLGLGQSVSVSADPDLAMGGIVKAPLWWRVGGVALIVYVMPNIYDLLDAYRPCIHTFKNESMTPKFFHFAWRPNLGYALALSVLMVFIVANLNAPAPFLYAGF
jgi:D-alanyl-lipoteichoic acid acyltransferase DltB (MBOAT superfamily)